MAGWQIDVGSSALNSMITNTSNMQTILDQETEQENQLYKLKLEHAKALAEKKKSQEEEIARKLIAQNKIVNETDFKQRKKDLEKMAKLELQAKLDNETDLQDAQKEAIINAAKLELKLKLKNLDEQYAKDKKLREQLEREQNLKKIKEESDALRKGLLGKGNSLAERRAALTNAFTTDGNKDLSKGFSVLTAAISDLSKQLDQEIESIAKKRSTIDTRLQGSKNSTFMGSYWDRISNDITGAAAISPYVRQADIATSVENMVGRGIAFNVEERAFLAAIKDKIAGTFDATSATLTRLVRIQQQDTTAARLGMESALTSFLNNMYETTEYMSEVASSIKSSIEEASALMGATNAVEFEYQVQKWMGSLYSVGMGGGSVQNIASALGQIAAGDISGINSNSGKLLLMAANNAGLSVSDMLSKGLDDSSVNTLMNAAVSYLAQIAGETAGNLVVQQQLASVFGLRASDLRAASNLSPSLKNINTNGLSYGGAMNQLYNMANTMYRRTSMGEMMTNAWANTKYSMASGIASNPALYGIYKIAGLLDDVAGGIALPDIKVMGTGVNLQTSVADLMRVASLSGGILSGLGNIIKAGGNGGITGSGLLRAFGVGSTSVVNRGSGGGLISTGGASVSSSGYIGNSSSGDIIGKTTGDANADANKQLVQAQDESDQVTTKTIDEHVVNIYTILHEAAIGITPLTVKMALNDMPSTNTFN